MAIKAIAAGTVEHGREIFPAAIWDIQGFLPEWLDKASLREYRGYGGRANFELVSSDVFVNGPVIDLSQVKPKLIMKRRKAHARTESNCQSCKRIIRALDERWQQYASKIPVLTQLTQVFRAYVAAKWLIAHNPALAMQIRRIVPADPSDLEPLYHVSPPVIRVRIQNGRLVPLIPDGDFYNIGGGYGGGINPSWKGKINPVRTGKVIDAWSSSTFPVGYSGDGYKVDRDGDRVGVALDIDAGGDHYTASSQRLLWISALVMSLLVGLAISAWERRRGKSEINVMCRRCRAVHDVTEQMGWYCDVVGFGTTAFLLLLPFVAALYEAYPSPSQALWSLVIVAAGIALPTLLVMPAQNTLRRRVRAQTPAPKLVRVLGSGARWAGLGIAVTLLGRGVTEQNVAEQIVRIFGLEVGQHLLAILGRAGTVLAAATTLLLVGLVSLVSRWLVPILANSRPLLIGSGRRE